MSLYKISLTPKEDVFTEDCGLITWVKDDGNTIKEFSNNILKNTMSVLKEKFSGGGANAAMLFTDFEAQLGVAVGGNIGGYSFFQDILNAHFREDYKKTKVPIKITQDERNPFVACTKAVKLAEETATAAGGDAAAVNAAVLAETARQAALGRTSLTDAQIKSIDRMQYHVDKLFWSILQLTTTGFARSIVVNTVATESFRVGQSLGMHTGGILALLRLEEAFITHTMGGKLELFNKSMDFTINSKQSPTQRLVLLQEIFSQLNDTLTDGFSQEMQVLFTLHALQKGGNDYSQLITSLGIDSKLITISISDLVGNIVNHFETVIKPGKKAGAVMATFEDKGGKRKDTHALTGPLAKKPKLVCTKCGKNGHTEKTCWRNNRKPCSICKKIKGKDFYNHTEKNCTTKPRNGANGAESSSYAMMKKQIDTANKNIAALQKHMKETDPKGKGLAFSLNGFNEEPWAGFEEPKGRNKEERFKDASTSSDSDDE